MPNKNKGGSLFFASLLGVVAGAIGGLLLAPKSGKETREDIKRLAAELNEKVKHGVMETKDRVKTVFGEANEAAVEKYQQIKDQVNQKLAALKTTGEEIDKNKYAKVVDDVIEDFRDDLAATKDAGKKLSAMLKKDWERVKKALG